MSDKSTLPISAAERERRRRNVRVTTGNQALEGLHPDAVELAEDEEYINGTATPEELIERAKEKYGAHSAPGHQQKIHGPASTLLLSVGVLALACAPGLLVGLAWHLWLAP